MASDRDAAVGVAARGVTRRFGGVTAVHGLSIRLPIRGVCGLLGPNGAGKTTTIRMIAGILLPDDGELSVLGLDALRDGRAIRAQVGYLPESAPLYPELTVSEYLRFRAGIMGLRGSAAAKTIAGAVERCDVSRFIHRCCGTLSKGMQQRVGLAAAILGDPRIVILDEPSVGLDPAQTLAFRDLVRDLGRSRLVLFSSHLLSEVESVCDEIAVIARGRVVAHESVARFRARAAFDARVHAEVDRSVGSDAAVLELCGSCSERALGDGWYRIEFTPRADEARAELARLLGSKGVRLRSLGTGPASLEQAFVDLVRAADAEAESSGGLLDRPAGTPRPSRPLERAEDSA